MFGGGSYEEVGRWLLGFVNSHAKRELRDWCYACRDEHSVLLAIQRENVVPIVGIDWNDEEAAGRDWLSKLGNPYARVASDRDGRTAIHYGVTAAPESFLISPEGVIVKKVPGVITPKIWREQLLPLIRGEKAAS